MTRLTDIANHVQTPEDADRLYVVDVSDTTDGPAGTSGYTTAGDLLQQSYRFYPDRAAAAAAQVPAAVTGFRAGDLDYRADPGGTALTTADGRSWSPAGSATYEHWGAVGNGAVDDSDAIRACHDWCIQNRVTCRPRGATYRVTKRILDYDVLVDGPGKEFHLKGAGKGQTVFSVTDDIAGVLFRIRGDTSMPNGARASNWSFYDFQVTSNGLVDADIFGIDVAASMEFRNVGIFNCRGRAMRLREVWDSKIEISIIQCGDDGTGTGPNTANKYAVEIDNFFGPGEPDLGSNSIDFTPRFQLAQSRYIPMYIGLYCKQNMVSGKIHGRLDGALPLPHVLLDGASRNIFYGAIFTVNGDTCVRAQSKAGINPFNNSFVGCHFDSVGSSCIELNNAQRHTVIGNTMINGTAGVHLVSGNAGNVIHSNTIQGGGVEMLIDAPAAVAPLRLPGDVDLITPGAELRLTAPNGTTHRLTVSNAGVLLMDGSPV